MKEFELEIITPERCVFKGRTHSLIVPAYDGYLGVMSGHAPFISILTAGMVTVRRSVGDIFFMLTGGVMETLPEKTTILADEAKEK